MQWTQVPQPCNMKNGCMRPAEVHGTPTGKRTFNLYIQIAETIEQVQILTSHTDVCQVVLVFKKASVGTLSFYCKNQKHLTVSSKKRAFASRWCVLYVRLI